MYHQSSRRKELIKRTIIYGIMCFSVVALVVVLLFIVLGYRFNKSDGRIEQGGLVQLDTRPGGADVTIDGNTLGSRTATKVALGAGQHFVTMARSGYRQWQKSVTVAPGSVVWLNYARLIPNELKTENVASFTSLSKSIASFNNKWVALKEDPASPHIILVDISRESIKQSSLEIPASSFSAPAVGKTQQFTLETWDPTNRYILVKHTYNDSALEWLVVDTENPGQTINVTRLVNVSMSNVVFSEASSSTLYVQVGTDVRKVETNSGTLSRPLVSNVAEFSLYDRSTVLYSTSIVPETGTRSVGYYEDGAEKPHTLKTFTDDGKAPLKLALGKYFNDSYVAIAYGEEVDVYRGSLPSGDATVANMTRETVFTQPGGAAFMEIRNKGRFIVVQKDGDFQVYDNELKQLTKTNLKNSATGAPKIGWLDGYYAWSDLGGRLRLYEFDGANQSDIMPVVSGQGITLAMDGLYIYGFAPAQDGTFKLTRVRMNVN